VNGFRVSRMLRPYLAIGIRRVTLACPLVTDRAPAKGTGVIPKVIFPLTTPVAETVMSTLAPRSSFGIGAGGGAETSSRTSRKRWASTVPM